MEKYDVIFLEPEINEVFELDGHKYQCIGNLSSGEYQCAGCAFYTGFYDCSRLGMAGPFRDLICDANSRDDECRVIFVEVDDNEDLVKGEVSDE